MKEIIWIPEEDMKPVYTVDVLGDRQKERANWGIKACNIPEAWKEHKGEGVKIAIVDTGMPWHDDINKNITGDSKNFTKESTVLDKNGHATHCAGIVGALQNGYGVVGVAPKAILYFYKALDKNGSGSFSAIAEAIREAVKDKVDIISLSLGATIGVRVLQDACMFAYNHNVIIFAAAGNDSKNVNYPARYNTCIAVSAINRNFKLAYFSSRGKTVDFGGPGVEILSTWLNNGYAMLSGTSMACPFIAGVGALILAKHRMAGGNTPVRNMHEMIEHMKRFCTDLGEVGKDKYFGYGVPDFKNNPDDYIEPEKPKKEPSWWQIVLGWLGL